MVAAAKRAKGSPTQLMMECVGISCFDPAQEEEELVAAAPEEVLLGAGEHNWRTAAPAREMLMGACALCHLVYWWQGPQHRSLASLREDARKDDAPAALAPPCEEKGGGGAYEFQDRKQVHKCVKAVIDTLHDEARVALWLDAIHCATRASSWSSSKTALTHLCTWSRS